MKKKIIKSQREAIHRLDAEFEEWSQRYAPGCNVKKLLANPVKKIQEYFDEAVMIETIPTSSLPLLIGTIKHPDNKSRLEMKLKNQSCLPPKRSRQTKMHNAR